MTDFGGLGGVFGGRQLNEYDLFEMAVHRTLGDRMRNDPELARRLWGSLSNVNWAHDDGDTASYSFRAAGDLIAAVIGTGDYLDWYCEAPYGVVDIEVLLALAAEGWSPESGIPIVRMTLDDWDEQ